MNKKGDAAVNWTVGILITLACLGLVFKFWLAPHIFLKQVDSAHEIIDKTYDADNAIYNYEWFKRQHETIKQTEKQIDNTMMTVDAYKDDYGDPKEWDWTTKQEYNRLKAVLLGQQNHYHEIVAEYNARSQMANREIFKDKLPFNVDKKIW